MKVVVLIKQLFTRKQNKFIPYRRQNNDPPKMSLSYSPEPVTILPHMAKGDFAYVFKIKILRCKDSPDDPGRSNVITGEAKGSERDLKMLLILKMEEGARSQGMREASRSWKKEGNRLFSRASRRNTDSPANTLILSTWDRFWTSDLCTLKIINLYYSKPLSLW